MKNIYANCRVKTCKLYESRSSQLQTQLLQLRKESLIQACIQDSNP